MTPEKVKKAAKTCQSFLRSHSQTLLELTTVIGLLSSTTQAVEHANIKYSVKISSTTTNCVPKEKNQLSVSNNIKHQFKNKINLVDRELEVLQWPNFFSVEPINDYSNRSCPDKVGSSLQRGSIINAEEERI